VVFSSGALFAGSKKEKGAPAGMGSRHPSPALRSSPRFGFPGQTFLFTAELKGGEDTEKFYCPKVVWIYPEPKGLGDSMNSITESDCPPFENREDYPRRWTWTMQFWASGEHQIHVLWLRGDKVIGKATTTIRISGGD